MKYRPPGDRWNKNHQFLIKIPLQPSRFQKMTAKKGDDLRLRFQHEIPTTRKMFSKFTSPTSLTPPILTVR